MTSKRAELERQAEVLTRQIGTFATQKQLQKAQDTYRQLIDAGLPASTYTFSNLINAHVMGGDVAGGERVMREMHAAGFQPNVVVYTTLLKGHCAIGDLHAAVALLQQMTTATPPVAADLRACNTFLRGASTCRTGSPCAARATAPVRRGRLHSRRRPGRRALAVGHDARLGRGAGPRGAP